MIKGSEKVADPDRIGPDRESRAPTGSDAPAGAGQTESGADSSRRRPVTPSLALFVAALLLAVAGAAWWIAALPEPRTVEIIIPTPSPLVVHVDGAVNNPGVYTLPPGSRAIDAIEAAGGATEGGPGAGFNLALPLRDGVRLTVPGRDSPAVTAPADPSVPTASSAAPSGLIDLNTATTTELQSLPGIGEVKAEAITAFLQQNGPVARVDELLAVSGIGPATIDRIRPLVAQQ